MFYHEEIGFSFLFFPLLVSQTDKTAFLLLSSGPSHMWRKPYSLSKILFLINWNYISFLIMQSFSKFIPLHEEFLPQLIKWDVAPAGHYKCSKSLFLAHKQGSLLCCSLPATSLSSAELLNMPRVKLNVSVMFPNNVTAGDLPLCIQCQSVLLESVTGQAGW